MVETHRSSRMDGGASGGPRGSKMTDGTKGGSKGAGLKALQALDLDALQEVIDKVPSFQKVLDELGKNGGVTIISLMREQIRKL